MLLVGMECFVKRHRQTLNELLGIDFGKSPSDSTFPLLLAQPGVAKELDRPNRLWCSALWPPADCVYIAQVSPTPRAWALRHLEAVELEGVLVQADALHGNRPFLYLAQRCADFLIAVSHRRRSGFRLIRVRLTYSRLPS